MKTLELRTVGRYVLEDRLSGGAVEVHVARDAKLGSLVRVKIVRASSVQEADLARRFVHDARTLASLAHPHMTPILDAGEHDGVCFVVTELPRGDALADTIRRRGSLSVREALEIARLLGSALDAAHSAGLFHRAVQPGNVRLGENGQVWLDGFPAEPDAVAAQGYEAPELARGGPASGASDRFAFAATVFEMLGGDPATRRSKIGPTSDARETLGAPLVSERHAEPPPELDAAFDRALASDPVERPGDCAAVVALLRDAAVEGGTKPPRNQATTPAVQPLPLYARERRRQVLGPVIGILCLVLAAYLIGYDLLARARAFLAADASIESNVAPRSVDGELGRGEAASTERSTREADGQ